MARHRTVAEEGTFRRRGRHRDPESDDPSEVAVPLEPVKLAEPKPPAFQGKAAASAVKWSGAAIAGKQGLQVAFGVVLARILGPQSYGVVGEATVYTTLSVLLLDQGLSAALVQRKELSPEAPGATATLNLTMGLILAVLTWFSAPYVADFFHTPQLAHVLQILGVLLMLKAIAVTPRALLSRRLNFAALAKADLSGALLGSVIGIISALLGASYYALIVQVGVTDLITAIFLLSASKGPRPNLAVHEIRTLLPFSARIFASNGLAYFSRNIDNILVARYLGTSSLSYYSMAYRVLGIPVQLLGQTVNRVLFPVFSRMAGQRDQVAKTLVTATEMLTLAAVPLMAFIACAAHDLVVIVLGDKWLPAAPLIAVLALAGARETIFYITPALMTALGRAELNLRFEIVSTGVQVAGIIVGLQFSVLGVGVGYALAGLLLTPLPMVIQRRLTGVTLKQQLGAMWPGIHAAIWGAVSYEVLRLLGLPAALQFVLGAALFAGIVYLVLRTFHREAAARSFGRIARMRPGAKRAAPPSKPKAMAG